MDYEGDIIDEDSMTPRVFDRTKKSMAMKSFNMNNNEGESSPSKKQTNRKKSRNFNVEDGDNRSINKMKRVKKDIAKTGYDYTNVQKMEGMYKNESTDGGGEKTDSVDNTETNGRFTTNTVKKSESSFMNNGWQTPKKSNVGMYYSGIDNPSTLKKYKTPCEMDMINPDESLIGNKCITINNYVNPPKYVAPVVTPSKFPLSGENNPHMTYDDFRCLFKHKACIISEHEFNSKKNCNQVDSYENKYIDCFTSNYENNSWPNKKEVSPSLSRSHTKMLHTSKESPRTKKRKVENGASLSTKKLLNELGKCGKDKRDKENGVNSGTSANSGHSAQSVRSGKSGQSGHSAQSVRSGKSGQSGHSTQSGRSGHSGKSGQSGQSAHSSGRGQQREGGEDQSTRTEWIDYEVNPVIIKGSNRAERNAASMDQMSKQKQNPLTPIYEPYSKDLDTLFDIKLIETPAILLGIYRGLIVAVSRRNQMNVPAFYQLVKHEVIQLSNCPSFTIEYLKQLAWIAPNLIQLNKVVITKEVFDANQQAYPEFVTGRKVEDIQIREHTDACENIYKYSPSDKLEMLKRIIINWVNVKHNELLRGINPNFYCPKYSELKKWHSTFNFKDILFPSVTLEENKILAQLAQTPQESNADDFIVIQDSPIKCATNDFRKNGTFAKDMLKEKTRTPLGRNRRRSNIIGGGSPFASSFNHNNNMGESPRKKETSNMKHIREEANKKNIIKEIKAKFDKEHETVLNEKKKIEDATWIAEIIHDTFIVEGTQTVIEINTFSKKIADKYKTNKGFQMDEAKIAQLIEILPQYVSDINLKPSMMDKNKMTLSVKCKKNLGTFLEPLTNKMNDLSRKYQEMKKNKEKRLNELWKQHNVGFELTESIKKYFLTPGSVCFSDI
ncbi:hypothetical protein PVIIG_01711 [Plasmodium vivax India VII]|uniref:CDT1 Geminin-binding domain-containing protein n=2 Tax=Plasmodium vivax TaxID=5855 RepID=A0A0J9SBE0_PLAVI|nr:hypothetical protein PVIIG_01711 [Plasmodium vivax India VII]KMZ85381.1 hypothetical protein PVBG_02067 [Plasmodium vivax Brazil I]CAI7721927.1 CDT1-like protein, putative [Plasmodium vivax]